MEALLPKCLNSLVIKDNLEALDVIVVNDGSKDRSSEIGHEYEQKYPGKFRVIDKPNGNYGSCINTALPECKGKYVKVLDSDDYFNTEEFDKFISELSSRNEELVLTDCNIVDKEGTITDSFLVDLQPRKVIPIRTFHKTLQMHNVTYKTSIFRQFNYKQSEGIPYTDQEWLFMPMTQVKSIVYLPYNVYQYLIGRDGQTMDIKVYLKNIDKEIIILKRMVQQWSEEIPEKNAAKLFIDSGILQRFRLILIDIHKYNGLNKSLFIELDKYIKNNYPKFYTYSSENSYFGKYFKYKWLKHWRKDYSLTKTNIMFTLFDLYLKLRQIKRTIKKVIP